MRELSPKTMATERLENEYYSIKKVISPYYTEYRDSNGLFHHFDGPSVICLNRISYWNDGNWMSTIYLDAGKMYYSVGNSRGRAGERLLGEKELKYFKEIAERMR